MPEENGTPSICTETQEQKQKAPEKSLISIPETREVGPEEQKRCASAASTLRPNQPSLRSISLPKGPAQANISPKLQHAQSIGDVENQTVTNLPEASKPKKSVSDYYKKQNELLENFKNDSEQIQVFQKTRTRQRLQSSTSIDEADKGGSSGDEKVTGLAPLVKRADGDSDVDIQPPVQYSLNGADPGGESAWLLDGQESVLKINDKKDVEKDANGTLSSESMMAKHAAAADKARASSKAASRLALVTLFVNVSLMMAKALASYLSGSLSIISSLVDSCVDITSGLVISVCSRMIKKRDPYLYPRGRTRLEPLSLIIISVVMGVASVQLIFDAIKRIVAAYRYDMYGEGEQPMLDMSWATVGIMVATVGIKGILFAVCQKYKSDPSIEVLAMDHRNDCVSNSVALACAWLAQKYWYYLDPIGAIIVSFYILWTWVNTGREHLSKLSGKSAKPEFINRIIKVCIDHDPRISHLDTVYVYHYGTKFLVEVHIVLDENMRLRVAHDISESLQINIESLPEVERAFVHTDYEYEHQPEDEHKVV